MLSFCASALGFGPLGFADSLLNDDLPYDDLQPDLEMTRLS